MNFGGPFFLLGVILRLRVTCPAWRLKQQHPSPWSSHVWDTKRPAVSLDLKMALNCLVFVFLLSFAFLGKIHNHWPWAAYHMYGFTNFEFWMPNFHKLYQIGVFHLFWREQQQKEVSFWLGKILVQIRNFRIVNSWNHVHCEHLIHTNYILTTYAQA